MKKILSLLATVLIFQNLVAQKVDLDKFTFKSSLTTFPENYVEPELRTFDIQVTMSPELSGFARSKYENLTIDGYSYSQNNPTVLTYVNVNRVKLVSSSIKSRVVEDKDKDGKVKSSKTYYFVEALFTGLGDYKVSGPVNPYRSLKELNKESKKNDKKKEKTDDNPFLKDASLTTTTSVGANNMKLETKTYNMTKEYRYTGTSYNSYSEARRNWEAETERKLYEYKGQYINDFFAAISSTLRYKYGYPITSDMYHLWILDSKSHPEYETQQKAIEAVKVLMPKLNGNADVKALAGELKPVLDYFKSLPTKYAADEKADKKMRYSAYYNLAKLYYLFDDAQSCIEYANLLIKNDYDTEDGEKLIEWAEELKNQFIFYKTDTRQAVK